MSKKLSLFATLISTIVLLITPSSPLPPTNLNLSFEGGINPDHPAIWIDHTGLHHGSFQEILPPESWTAFWYDGFPCVGAPNWKTGRPEFRLTSYPGRVQDGSQAAFFFTTYRCHEGGLLQVIGVTPGATIRASCYAHMWWARCSQHADSPCPLDEDCTTCIDWAWSSFRVGIDPLGGVDPRSSSIVWSTPTEYYGTYGPVPAVIYATIPLTSTEATFFLLGKVSHPFKHNDEYVDACTWEEVTLSYLPTVLKGIP